MDVYLNFPIRKLKKSFGFRLNFGDGFMDFLLQFGYGMIDHSRSLVREWGGGTVILSPRDLNSIQLKGASSKLKSIGGSVLLDPQFYLPHSDHARLCGHDYWPKEYDTINFWNGEHLRGLLDKIYLLNKEMGCERIILPGLYAESVDDDWIACQRAIIGEAEIIGPEKLISTVALSGNAVKNNNQVHKLLGDVEEWNVGCIYLICEHPNGRYLVEDPNWLSNVLDLVAGFRRCGKKVILGYCNHQFLIASVAGANAIASGTWMNVRSFPPEKFNAQCEEEIKQRSIWYYCPQALSEFKVTYLDVAYRQSILMKMAPDKSLNSTYANALFGEVQPTTVGFSEQSAFRHYLQCLKSQVANSSLSSFVKTLDYHKAMLDKAEKILSELHAVEVRGQLRDFSDCIDANRAALAILENTHGPALKRCWSKL